MLNIMWLLCMSSILAVVHCSNWCQYASDPSSPKMPDVPGDFKLKVEGTIVEKNYSFVAEEYHDLTMNHAALYLHSKNISLSFIYNYNDYEAYTIKDGVCTVRDLHKPSRIKTFAPDHSGHVQSMKVYWHMSFNYTYVQGEHYIRGIPVNKWSGCYSNGHANVSVDWYFSKPGYWLAFGNETLPVRSEINGTGSNHRNGGTHTFHNIYDFVSFEVGPIKDKSVFQTPKGVVCPNRTYGNDFPMISDQMTVSIEMIKTADNSVTYMKEMYDYKNKMFAIDMVPRRSSMSPGVHSMGDKYGFNELRIINDFNSGLQYVLNRKIGNCSITPIPKKSQLIELDSTHAYVRMLRARDMIMRNSSSNATFEGQRIVRNIPVDVWLIQKQREDTAGNSTDIEEFYFTQKNWTVLSNENVKEKQILWGAWISHKTIDSQGKLVNHSTIQMNMFEYYEGHPDLASFDVGSCFRINDKLQFTITLQNNYDDVVYGREQTLHKAIRKTMAQLAGVTASRIDNIMFGAKTNDSWTDVWFTILGPPNVEGDVSDVTLGTKTTLTAAHNSLTTKLRPGYPMFVDYTDGKKKVMIISGSLVFHPTLKPKPSTKNPYPFRPKTVPDMIKPTKKTRYVETAKQGYSKGDMAGLAFGMIIMGCAIGLGIAFIVYKRVVKPREVPYDVQM